MIKNIIILILILGFIGIVIFLDIPALQGTSNLKKQINQEKRVFSDKQTLLAKVENLKEAYFENQENLKKVDYILPSNQDVPNLIVQLEALALEGGLILENMEISVLRETGVSKAQQVRGQEEAQIKDYNTLAISLKLTGNYPGLKNFLKAVEENIRLMDVYSIDFSTISGQGVEFFNFNLILRTYYQ